MSSLFLQTSTKADGNLSFRCGSRNEVLTQQEIFLLKHNKAPGNSVSIETEDGDRVTVVDASHKGQAISTEALITSDKEVLLLLTTADCFPVVFHDPVQEVLALAHVGWRPADKKLPEKVVHELKEKFSSQPEDIKIHIGPGIHKESYVFTDLIQAQKPEWARFLIPQPNGETAIDLLGYIQHQLVVAGIPEANIETSPINTATSNEYFSHYRSVRTGEAEGRFITVAGLV